MMSEVVRRESGCPVHFVWDGVGRGRKMVRATFVGLLAGGALLCAARMWPGAWTGHVQQVFWWCVVAYATAHVVDRLRLPRWNRRHG
jgi:hypothetical protein